MGLKPVIYGVSGHNLSDDEKSFLRDIRPVGFILFGRNCADNQQVKTLIKELKNLYDYPLLILIDEEGGEISRLPSPEWKQFAPAIAYGEAYPSDPHKTCFELYQASLRMAIGLRDLGINVNCFPVLDVPIEGAHPIIGKRAYSQNPNMVAHLGKQAVAGLLAGGVLPVIKHIPGHGRALLDSHLSLPMVDEGFDNLTKSDFLPFRSLSQELMAMTAHIAFSQIDPHQPATLSPTIIADIIRADIGFDGLLLTDNIGMGALQQFHSGSVAGLAIASLEAGCDIILHCSGVLSEMIAIGSAINDMKPKTRQRLDRIWTQMAIFSHETSSDVPSSKGQ